MALIICKECGKEISDAAGSCPYCGSPVASAPFSTSTPNFEKKERFCPRCGASIQENASFCPKCGYSIAANPVVRKTNSEKKDKMVAGLLAIFIGTLGIQYFYLGKTTAGILTIVITLCSCGIWSILMLIQGILMLTMSEEDFQTKYVDTEKTFPLF